MEQSIVILKLSLNLHPGNLGLLMKRKRVLKENRSMGLSEGGVPVKPEAWPWNFQVSQC